MQFKAYALFAVLAFWTFLCVPKNAAYSFSKLHDYDATRSLGYAQQDHNSLLALNSAAKEPSSAASDACLPLLRKASRLAPSKSVADRNRRPVGETAAPTMVLGLVLGVRFALSPPESLNGRKIEPRFDAWLPHGDIRSHTDRSALAIMAYRQCQKEKALQALDVYKWSR